MLSSILPHFAARQLATLRQETRLARLPPRTFQADVLRSVEKRDLDRIFSDAAIHAAWERDSERMLAVASKNAPHSTDYGERRAIYYLIAGLRPSTVLEVGTNRGLSTMVMAQALATHVGEEARIVSLDIFDVNGAGVDEPPRKSIDALHLSDMVSFRVERSLAFLERTKERFDFIFLDGDHAATSVYSEISAALGCLTDDGTILLHDFHPGNRHVFKRGSPIPGPYLAVRRINSEGCSIQALPLGQLPWTTRDDIERVSCLAVLTRV